MVEIDKAIRRPIEEEKSAQKKRTRPTADATGVKNAIAARAAKMEKPVAKGPRRIIVRR
jgi:hypothetical protein